MSRFVANVKIYSIRRDILITSIIQKYFGKLVDLNVKCDSL